MTLYTISIVSQLLQCYQKLNLKVKVYKMLEVSKTLWPKKVSKLMSLKLGNSGLCLKHVQLAYSRGGPGGILELLKEKVDGKGRLID